MHIRKHKLTRYCVLMFARMVKCFAMFLQIKSNLIKIYERINKISVCCCNLSVSNGCKSTMIVKWRYCQNVSRKIIISVWIINLSESVWSYSYLNLLDITLSSIKISGSLIWYCSCLHFSIDHFRSMWKCMQGKTSLKAYVIMLQLPPCMSQGNFIFKADTNWK